MKVTMGSAKDAGHGASLNLEQINARFAQWRLGRKRGERVARSADSAHTAKAPHQFVELFTQPAPSAAPASPCIVEMQNVRGAKMRVELGSIAGLDGLVSAFWGAR